MNRNTNLHFNTTPQLDLKRSKFDLSHSVKTTFNAGEIIPIGWEEVLPGDTWSVDMAELVRMSTPIYPVMDNCYIDTYAFFCPNRLLWDHWVNFWGENDDPWIQSTPYEIPQITIPTNGWPVGTIAEYLNVPINKDGDTVNALPFRMYCKVYNDWFKNENVSYSVHMYTDETTRTGKTGSEVGYDPVTDTEFGGLPLKACKFHDYFTSALPTPQKGPAVNIPITGQAVVKTATTPNNTTNNIPIDYNLVDGTNVYSDWVGVNMVSSWGNASQGIAPEKYATLNSSGVITKVEDKVQAGVSGYNYDQYLAPNNLYADLSTMTATTINALRTAFAIQKYYENAGLHGTRYIEYLRGVFGVTSSDARLQRSEYLGGKRVPVNMDAIVQTSSTDTVSPQGNASGFSCTLAKHNMFTKSFEEHGIIMYLAVIRTDRTYQQGLERKWTRKTWTDYYNPFFANLGEQAILNKEIYFQGQNAVDSDGKPYDDQAFGYQEAWAEYRYSNSYVTGYMRSDATGSLDVWHYADDYNSLPYLSDAWMQEPKANIDRTIAVSSQLAHQFIADFYVKQYATRVMPVYSIPGLIDHV